MNAEARIQEALADFDVDIAAIQDIQRDGNPTSIDTQTLEATVIQPYPAGQGHNEDRTLATLLADGTKVSITVKKRLECPCCKHVVADPERPNNLAGECTKCRIQVCPRCRSTCTGCEVPLCPNCTRSYGVDDGVYCPTCRAEVKEAELRDREQTLRQDLFKQWKEAVETQRTDQNATLEKLTNLLQTELSQQKQTSEELRKTIKLQNKTRLDNRDADRKDRKQEWTEQKESQELYQDLLEHQVNKEISDRETTIDEWGGDGIQSMVELSNWLVKKDRQPSPESHGVGASRYEGEEERYQGQSQLPDGQPSLNRDGLPSHYPDPEMRDTR